MERLVEVPKFDTCRRNKIKKSPKFNFAKHVLANIIILFIWIQKKIKLLLNKPKNMFLNLVLEEFLIHNKVKF